MDVLRREAYSSVYPYCYCVRSISKAIIFLTTSCAVSVGIYRRLLLGVSTNLIHSMAEWRSYVPVEWLIRRKGSIVYGGMLPMRKS